MTDLRVDDRLLGEIASLVRSAASPLEHSGDVGWSDEAVLGSSVVLAALRESSIHRTGDAARTATAVNNLGTQTQGVSSEMFATDSLLAEQAR